jgi:hypothetical protein
MLSTPKGVIFLGSSLPAADLHGQFLFSMRFSQPDGGLTERDFEVFELRHFAAFRLGRVGREPQRQQLLSPSGPT